MDSPLDKLKKFYSLKFSKYQISSIILLLFTFTFLINVPYRKVIIQKSNEQLKLENDTNWSGGSKDFLVHTSHCKIPDFNPFSSDVMEIIQNELPEECRNMKPVTKLIKNNGEIWLEYDEKLRKLYYPLSTFCCYQDIYRAGSNETADMLYEYVKIFY